MVGKRNSASYNIYLHTHTHIGADTDSVTDTEISQAYTNSVIVGVGGLSCRKSVKCVLNERTGIILFSFNLKQSPKNEIKITAVTLLFTRAARTHCVLYVSHSNQRLTARKKVKLFYCCKLLYCSVTAPLLLVFIGCLNTNKYL